MAFTISGVSDITGLNLTTTHPIPAYYMWAWGSNYKGKLGLGDTTTRSSPTQVGALTDWENVYAGGGSATAGLKTNGTLWTWGNNAFHGRLGHGDTIDRSSPTQVGALTNWASMGVGNAHMIAIKTDGTLWAWGYNADYGNLGLGNLTNYSSPKQVGALTAWSKISTGYNNNLALKTDGTLWAWGHNPNGQLGLGDTNNRSSPTQVGALTTWSSIHAGEDLVAAIKTDGTLWMWGQNNAGQLGLGNTTYYSSPKQVGADTNWASASVDAFQSIALKTNGTLWAWGANGGGQLGLGNTTNRSSPVQIGALTTWSSIGVSGYHTHAIKTDGTLWGWGANFGGLLGLGNATYFSSPVQVGALSTWSKISVGYLYTMAIG
jgi:alpha-tubulin suppressor-like RCC1 family protein